MANSSENRKVVLAYSGGLDTSVIAHWLREDCGYEVIAYTADLGQQEDLEAVRQKAESMGISRVIVDDLRETFVRDFIWPMFRSNPRYEGTYLLGTSIARPLISRELVRVAREEGATAIAHGCTGKGNDQVRFELAIQALAPDIEVIAPWRTWDISSREELLNYCQQRQIPVEQRKDKPSWSMDANLLHISYEGGELEDPNHKPPANMWRMTKDPVDGPDMPEQLTITFADGDPIAINGTELSAADLLATLNELAGNHGIGRLDMVENRFVGLKSRGCYETPGGEVVAIARRAIESITLDGGLGHLKDSLMPAYSELIYNGYWYSDKRRALQAFMDSAAQRVSGDVTLELYKGGVTITGRTSPHSLYDESLASFEEDGDYDHADAAGFIRLHALPLKRSALRDAERNK